MSNRMTVEIEDWRVRLPAASVKEARRTIVNALRTAGIKVPWRDLPLGVWCQRCKYFHSGDCASI